jgi:hypothetical protein
MFAPGGELISEEPIQESKLINPVTEYVPVPVPVPVPVEVERLEDNGNDRASEPAVATKTQPTLRYEEPKEQQMPPAPAAY